MPRPETLQPATHPHAHRRTLPLGVLVALASVLGLIFAGLRRGRGQFDEEVFHEPTIRQFASQWPRPDLSNYLSATTPGYHLVLSAVARLVSDHLLVLKVAGAMFTLVLVWLLERAVRVRLARVHPSPPPGGLGDDIRTLVLLSPLLCSMYFLFAGVWLLPDNAGWLGVLGVLLLALRPRWDWVSVVVGGLLVLALAWTRQSHVWTAGVLWVAAWLGSGADPGPPIWTITRARLQRAGIALVATLPAFVSLVWLARLWGGLTPPGPGGQFHQQHADAINPATPAFALALLAIYSVFFWAWTGPGLRALCRGPRGRMIVGGCIAGGLVLAAAPATTFLYEARATGLWNVVKVMDAQGLTIAGRTSPLLLVLAPAGALALGAWLMQLPRRQAWIYGLSFAGFVAAQTANANAWQRYFEPMLLMILALMAATIGWRPGRLAWFGPLALGVLLAMLTAYTLWREPVFVKTWSVP